MALKQILKEANNVTYQGSVTGLSTASTTTLENATSIQYGYGYFGDSSRILCNIAAGVPLVVNTHFAYNKRLDKSIIEDVTYGFGTNAGGIYDTGNSSAFASGKCLRIVENAANIATTLGLQVWAKQMSSISKLISPPYNMCYIDPISRLFVLPSPSYWSKCESLVNLTLPDILINNIILPSIEFNNGNISFSAGKFNNAFVWNGPSSTNCIYNTGIKFSNSGMMSFYFCSSVGSHKEQQAWVGDSEGGLFRVNLGASETSYSHYLQINSSTVSSDTTYMGTYKHVFIIWDIAKTISGGKSVSIYIDNVEVMSSTATISDLTSTYMRFKPRSDGANGADYVGFDNIKIWNNITDYANILAMEYNGGAGNELALDNRYQSSNNYQPILTGTSGVGYISKTNSTTVPVIITGSGTNVSPTAETVTLIQGAVGTFGTIGGALNTDGYIPLTFTYDSRLDATGGNNVDIFDTGTAGVLAGGKYIRIANNGVNVKSLTGITQIIAKNLNINQTPPANTIYIDPTSGKYVMPMPCYWSKCESEANLVTSPEIYNMTYPPSKTGTAYQIGSGIYVSKFGNGVYHPGTANSSFYPFGNNVYSFDKATISFWNNTMRSGFIQFRFFLKIGYEIFWIVEYYASGSYMGLNSNSTSYTHIQQLSHFYIVIDKDAGLTGGKTCRVFVDGVERLSSTAILGSQQIPEIQMTGADVGGGYVSLDNLKIWNHVVSEDPSFEYNAGAGRETALHTCYGITDNYAPSNNTVGYYRSGYLNNHSKIHLLGN